MEHQNVNEELMNNEQNSVEETPAVVEQPTVEESTTADAQENVVVETSEDSSTASVTEDNGDVDLSESDALAPVKEMLTEGRAEEEIPRALPLELVLLLEQTNSVLGSINLEQAKKLVSAIKHEYDNRKASDAFPAELEGRFTTAYARFNKKRADEQKKSEEENANRKRALIEQLKTAIESGDMQRNTVKDIQTEWKKASPISKEAREELDPIFQALLDSYYKKRSQEIELMDYDRKRNLETKNEIIAKIRALLPNEEEAHNAEIWRERQQVLNELQRQWREAGFVPKEDMERINMDYKQAVDIFFEKRREYVESQEQGMQENGEKKEEILGRMAEYTAYTSEKPKEWEEATAKFLALQEEWKAVGKAPNEKNGELWKRFREIGNTFFDNKSNFFKNLEAERTKNMEAKKAICERAEALKESEDWEGSAKEIKKLQDEWKQVGPVPDKISNKLWDRFRSACDAFFVNRREHYKGVKSDEEANLEKKRVLIEEVKTLTAAFNAETREETVSRVKEIQEDWKKIGKVPIKQKDTIWDAFKAEVDAFFAMLRAQKPANTNTNNANTNTNRPPRKEREDRGERRERSNHGGDRRPSEDQISSGIVYPPHIQAKISRLKKKISRSQEKVDQYGTNILFIARGKAGDKLRAQIQAEIDAEAALIVEWKNTIKELDAVLKNPNPEKEKELLDSVEDTDDAAEDTTNADA
ncbi:MAG: DUF349 domain-containing protein [Bacteroidia bacterium]